MSAINKLEFLSKYGNDKHKAGVEAKVDSMVHNLPERGPEGVNPWDNEERNSVPRSALVKGDHLTKMIEHPDPHIRAQAAKNPNLESHHIDKIVNSGDERMMSEIASPHNPSKSKVTPEHLHKILDHPATRIHPASLMGYRKDLDDSHWAKIASHHAPLVTTNAIHTGNMPMKHLLHIAINHPDSHTVHMARQQRVENLKKGIKDE